MHAYKAVKIPTARIKHIKHMCKETIHIFTDGSCVAQTKEGGWGCILLYGGHEKKLCGHKAGTTNNEMELAAILFGLRAIKDNHKHRKIVIYSDSKYSICCVTTWYKGWQKNGWLTSKGQPVRNKELIADIVAATPKQVVFKWVKGHAGHKYNEVADELASLGRTSKGLAEV